MLRRDAIRLMGGALAAPALSGLSACRASARAAPVSLLGIQLYTLRREMQEDVAGTLAGVAEIGYGEVEFAGYFGRTPAEIRELLDATGLTAPAAHVGYDVIGEPWERTLADAATIGHRALIVPSLPRDLRASLDGYRRVAEAFDRAGEQARGAGLGFGFHNHDVELAPVEGTVPLDLLIAETDPANVFIELDVFWAKKGGADPLAYMTAPGRRVRMIHAKDMAADGSMVDPGEGTIDFAAILEAGRANGLEHVFVEHDTPESAMGTARAGFAHLGPLLR